MSGCLHLSVAHWHRRGPDSSTRVLDLLTPDFLVLDLLNPDLSNSDLLNWVLSILALLLPDLLALDLWLADLFVLDPSVPDLCQNNLVHVLVKASWRYSMVLNPK